MDIGNYSNDLASQSLIMDILHYDLMEAMGHIHPVLAQTFDNVDVLGDMQVAWTNFVETGQVWALLVGVFIGYVFKGFTSY